MTRELLEYASGLRRSVRAWWVGLRRAVRYALVALVVGLAMVVAVVSYDHPWVWYGSREAYQRHRALGFTMPPDRVVYEEHPILAAGLLARPVDPETAYVGEPLSRHGSPRAWEVPAGEYRTNPNDATYAEYVPRFHQWSFGPQTARGLVFLHERVGTSGKGRRAMVTLERSYGRSDPTSPGRATRDGVELTAWSSAADRPFRLLHGNNKRRIFISLGRAEVMRIYAGQVDPEDGGRFTIKYEVDCVAGTIEGRVGADDAVRLRVMDGPVVRSWRRL